jgi:hypothetical protein
VISSEDQAPSEIGGLAGGHIRAVNDSRGAMEQEMLVADDEDLAEGIRRLAAFLTTAANSQARASGGTDIAFNPGATA